MSRANGPATLVGIDVGGTFTDVIARSPDGRLHHAKVPSLPGEQWLGVLDALTALSVAPSDIAAFVHGTTIVTNALLERKGARTALVTTRGFRDAVEIGKNRRLTGGLFDATWQRPTPIVPRPWRLEIDERLDAKGEVVRPLETTDVEALAYRLAELDVESVAVSLVNAYVDSRHEATLVAALRERLPGRPVSGGALLVGERGEFERTSTAILNAYLTPVMTRYLDALTAALADRGVQAPVNVMGSNGGAMSLATARERCAATFLSGPVGGVTGAVHVARDAGVRDIITFDMGGTSTDVALVHDLAPRMAHDNLVDAWPLRLAQLDIHTIGAGGGSLVARLGDGTLGVGPQSAGALPGPACYGRGGTGATLSDANLLLGRLPSERPLAGGLVLDRDAAAKAFDAVDPEADPLRLAEASLAIAVAKMAGAVRTVSVHRGFDPREFTLVGFGGAGPMHAMAVADELGMDRVLIPRHPGHLSALGQMLSDVRHDGVLAWGGKLAELAPPALEARIEGLAAAGRDAVEADGVGAANQTLTVTLDVRYAGQSFTLPVSWPGNESAWDGLRERFHAHHAETFGYADRDAELEIVNIRAVTIGRVDKPPLAFVPEAPRQASGRRPVRFDGETHDTEVLDREALAPGDGVAGPAIIEEAGGTTVVPPGWAVSVTDGGALLARRQGPGAP